MFSSVKYCRSDFCYLFIFSSPSYQLADKNKKNNENKGGAPLADPEPISDVSTTGQSTSPGNGTTKTPDEVKQPLRALQNINIINISGDSATNSPLALTPPCELPTVAQNLSSNLIPLYGRPNTNRRTEKDKKIVIYVLASDEGWFGFFFLKKNSIRKFNYTIFRFDQ